VPDASVPTYDARNRSAHAPIEEPESRGTQTRAPGRGGRGFADAAKARFVCSAQYGELPAIFGSPQNRAAGSRMSPSGQRQEDERSCRIGVPGFFVGAFAKRLPSACSGLINIS